MKKAVVLFSGGMDSSTCLAWAKREGFTPCALSVMYRQRHRVELEAARRVAESLGVDCHMVLDVGLDRIGGSALTSDLAVPKDTPLARIGQGIPATYVPARNTVFLSLALGWAEILGTGDIVIGVNALDYSGYPDCRPEFIEAFERMANLATREAVEGRVRVKIHTPLLHLDKAGVVRLGRSLGLDFGLTHTCYDPDPAGLACGRCESCQLRRKGFAEAGVPDPTRYAPALDQEKARS